MRILFLTHYFPPEGNAPASRVHNLTRRWVEAGHEVTVITGVPNVPDGKVYDGYKNRWRQREVIDGVEVIRVWTWLAANRGVRRRTLNYVSYMLTATLAGLRVPKPDVVIATSPQFLCGWAGVLVSTLRRRRFVLEVRDLWPESIVAVGAMSRRVLVRLLEWLERRMYEAADRIVTVGEGYRDRLVERGVPAERITILPNGVDRAVFRPDVDGWRIRAQYGLRDRFVCSYIGTIGMGSGLDVAVRAGEKLREKGLYDPVILLVGDGAIRKELEAEVTARGLDNVVFTGRQPKGRIPEFVAASDACLVHLRKTDLFTTVMPTKVFEAAASARPVILGVEGHAAALVAGAEAGVLIEPDNEDELVKAIETLASDRHLARRLGANGREVIAEHYDIDRLAADYLQHLEKGVVAATG